MTAPAWALGYDVAELKKHATVFKGEFAPYIHGAFGLPKERDIANAKAENRFVTEGSAVAICRIVTQRSAHSDFAGNYCSMWPEDVFVSAIAGADRLKLLECVGHARSRKHTIWVEIFAENTAVKKELERVGFRAILYKVSASSDIKCLMAKGTHPPQVPYGRADTATLKVLQPDFLSVRELDAVLNDLSGVKKLFAQHYSSYNKAGSWTAFALKGYTDDPAFIIKPAEMSKKWKEENAHLLESVCRPTTACKWFPSVKAILKRIPAETQRVRFMRLRASDGELTRHADITDKEAGTRDGMIVRLHIPIITHESVQFTAWDHTGVQFTKHFPLTGLCYLDTRKPHAARNPSNFDRVHLVVDAHSNKEIRRMLEKRESAE